jgi:ElaB/YqjD/DUF883 family membrane-anchored ribosome-binding protein
MAFTEKDMKEQEQVFAALKDEFSRLNARHEGMLKDAGLSADDLKKSLAEKQPPEMEKLLEQAKAEAAQAGKARAAQSSPAESAPAGKSGRGRPGAVRL